MIKEFWVLGFCQIYFWEKNFRFSFFPSTKNKEQDTKEEEERFLRGSVVVGVTEESERRKREKKEREERERRRCIDFYY